MTDTEMLSEVRDTNLNYLMLSQKMIREDKPAAIFCLGLSHAIADLIESLSSSQMIKLAASSMMLARFRFDDSAILGMLTNYNKDAALTKSHAAIIMAGQSVEQIA
jgi:flagellar transcriptional activator FlhD